MVRLCSLAFSHCAAVHWSVSMFWSHPLYPSVTVRSETLQKAPLQKELPRSVDQLKDDIIESKRSIVVKSLLVWHTASYKFPDLRFLVGNDIRIAEQFSQLGGPCYFHAGPIGDKSAYVHIRGQAVYVCCYERAFVWLGLDAPNRKRSSSPSCLIDRRCMIKTPDGVQHRVILGVWCHLKNNNHCARKSFVLCEAMPSNAEIAGKKVCALNHVSSLPLPNLATAFAPRSPRVRGTWFCPSVVYMP